MKIVPVSECFEEFEPGPQHVEACLKAGVDIFWIGALERLNKVGIKCLAAVQTDLG